MNPAESGLAAVLTLEPDLGNASVGTMCKKLHATTAFYLF